MMTEIPAYWRKRKLLSYLLLPLAGIFLTGSYLRRCLYRYGIKSVYRPPVPVIVVGNLTVGGNGKTPLVLALAKSFTAAGIACGVISRGYGGKAKTITDVSDCPDAATVGDEPLLIYQQTGVPVVIGGKRAQAAAELLRRYPQTQVLISDDGLQHYALARDIEIVMIAPDLALGNGFCLPAGPLREMPQRLKTVTMVVNGNDKETYYGKPRFTLNYRSNGVRYLNEKIYIPFSAIHSPCYALTSIARPERFFDQLRRAGIVLAGQRAFPDHAPLPAESTAFAAGGILLISEKDAVKTTHWTAEIKRRTRVVEYQAEIPAQMWQSIREKLRL